MITDFTAHPFWAIDGIDASFVATAAVREELAAWGVAWDSIHVTGIPIDPRFAQGPLDRAEARAQFQLAPDRPTVLLMGGGNGVGPLASLAERVLDLPSAPQLLVVCGKNARLRMRMRAVAEAVPGRVRVLGFTDQVPALLSAADVIATKAGRADLQREPGHADPDGGLPPDPRAGGEELARALGCRRRRPGPHVRAGRLLDRAHPGLPGAPGLDAGGLPPAGPAPGGFRRRPPGPGPARPRRPAEPERVEASDFVPAPRAL